MISEERFIARLRKRRTRLIVYAVLLAVFLSYSVFIFLSIIELQGEIIREEITIRMKSPGNSPGDITMVTSNSRSLERMNRGMVIMCLGIGILVTALVSEITGASKDRLIVSLWDRVRELERRIQQTDRQVFSESATIASSKNPSS